MTRERGVGVGVGGAPPVVADQGRQGAPAMWVFCLSHVFLGKGGGGGAPQANVEGGTAPELMLCDGPGGSFGWAQPEATPR